MFTVDQDTLRSLENKESFVSYVHQAFHDMAMQFGLSVHFNKALAQDAYFQWMQDIERVRQFEQDVNEPDHIKKCAHLIYWLRRFSPVNDFVRVDFEGPAEVDAESYGFIMKYGREYLAFDLGYQIARHYECTINNRKLPKESFSVQSAFPEIQSHDLLKTIVHVMKTKMMSPQGFVITLKAIFLRP